MDEVTHSPGEILRGRYRIEGVIGSGAYGMVYRAADMSAGGSVRAIKEIWEANLDDDERRVALDLFRKEVTILGGLNHPGIPGILEFFSENNHHYIVMEFIDGKTMEDTVGEKKPEPATAVAWGTSICEILEYLHSMKPAPIIFRDLKPSNIMIMQSGRVMMIDFGIARFFNPMKDRDTSVLGTPGFAAPEQYGRSQSDARSDIYSLGATLFNSISGRDPANFGFFIPPLSRFAPGVSPELERVVARCLNRDPAQRYGSAAEVRKELQECPESTGAGNAPLCHQQQSHDASPPHTHARAEALQIMSSRPASPPPGPLPAWARKLFSESRVFALYLVILLSCTTGRIYCCSNSGSAFFLTFIAIAATLVSLGWYVGIGRIGYGVLILLCFIVFFVAVPRLLLSRKSAGWEPWLRTGNQGIPGMIQSMGSVRWQRNADPLPAKGETLPGFLHLQ